MSDACPKCGQPGGRWVTHVCMTAGVHSHQPDPLREYPPGWKGCPHCLGSGMVQADDMRETTPPWRQLA